MRKLPNLRILANIVAAAEQSGMDPLTEVHVIVYEQGYKAYINSGTGELLLATRDGFVCDQQKLINANPEVIVGEQS